MTEDQADGARSPRLRRVLASLPVLLVSAVAAFAIVNVRTDDAAAPAAPATADPATIDIAASGPRFDSLGDLIAASDVIAEGRIVAVDEGRAITDPSDPTAGFTTALFQLEVTRSYRGGDVDSFIVEQEAALLDGTPITVNGLVPNRVGDTGFWFLVRGTDDAFPYLALVNEQARVLVDETGGVEAVPGGRLSAERLRMRLDA